jgi:MSHA type pilus biogenesis protein MshL
MVIYEKIKMRSTLFMMIVFSLFSCVSSQPVKTLNDTAEPGPLSETSDIESGAPVETSDIESLPLIDSPPEIPDFIPVKEGSSPLKTKTVSVSARNTPLRDVLYIIAETASLNLVMERGVRPEIPVTMTFRDLSVEDALNIVFDSVDYFYLVKDNILIVKAMKTEMFELGQPNIIPEYSINVGGDILSGTSSGAGGQGAISGDVSVKSTLDKPAFKFWEAMENSLKTLLSIQSEGETEEGPGQAGFVINRMAGTIMVTATKSDLEKVGNYITNIKNILNRQVLVEARIVEVQLTESLKYGIDWTLIFDGFHGEEITLSTELFSDVVSSTSPAFKVNIASSDDLTLLLKALQEQGEVRTLSNPRVSILNGQTTMLSVGRNTTFISSVETTTNQEGSSTTTTFTVETNSVLSGVMFGLVPYINSEQEITIAITPIVTNLVELDTKTVGASDNSVEIKLPTVDLREMSTTVKVLDGQIIIIGGLIDKKEKLEEDQVPVLGDIPLIGKLFKSVSKSYENTELVIMLIPKIVS